MILQKFFGIKETLDKIYDSFRYTGDFYVKSAEAFGIQEALNTKKAAGLGITPQVSSL